MSSPARQIANTANAQHSTGPRTEEGKARAAQNARTHGLCAAELVITAEDREEFEDLLAQYQAEIRPQGPLQQVLFNQLVEADWHLRRIRRMETELSSVAGSYLELLNDDAVQKKLDRLARHKTRIERSFYRSLKELKELQTNTALAGTIPQIVAETAPPLASISQFAKRTQTLARGANPDREFRALLSVPSFKRNPERETGNEKPETELT